MALDKAGLIANLLSAYNDSNAAELTNAQFAELIADAIDIFVKTGTVTTPSGVAVTVNTGTGVGATTAPGIGTIA